MQGTGAETTRIDECRSENGGALNSAPTWANLQTTGLRGLRGRGETPQRVGRAGRQPATCGTEALTEGGDAMKELIESADRMLYRAKNEGRNRVVSGPVDSSPES